MPRTRYNLDLPDRTYKGLQEIGGQDGTTVADLLRKATRLFLFVQSIKQDPDARLLIECKGEIQEIVIDLL